MAQVLEANLSEAYQQDVYFMRKALKLARKGKYTTSPNPAVGCVIVKDQIIIAQGYHHKAGQPHAEAMALKDARESVEGATCYVTLEPCAHYGRTPPCAKALAEAKVKRVVIASTDPNPLVAGKGIAILEEAGIQVDLGVCQEQALRLNRAFFKSISQNEPYTIVKLGMSLDGKLALSDGQSKWITNDLARSDVQRLRLWADAIISSHLTVKADNPRLNVRYEQLPKKIKQLYNQEQIKQPIKVILDSQGSLLKDQAYLQYELFKSGLTYLVVATKDQASLTDGNNNFNVQKLNDHVSLVQLPFACSVTSKDGQCLEEHIDLNALLKFLGTLQIRVAMVEAGPKLSSAFIGQRLADEFYCYIGNKILGKGAQEAFLMPEPKLLDSALELSSCKFKILGNNIRYSGVLKNS